MAFLFNNLLEVAAQIEQKASAVPKKWAGRVVQHAQDNAPVLTGYMKEHIVDASDNEVGAAESQAPYSGYVNFGTVKMAAEPFFSQAIEQARGELPDAVDEAFSGVGGI